PPDPLDRVALRREPSPTARWPASPGGAVIQAGAVVWCHYSLGREEEPTSLSVTGRLGRPRQGRLGAVALPVRPGFDRRRQQGPYRFTTQARVVPDVLSHRFEEFRKTLK